MPKPTWAGDLDAIMMPAAARAALAVVTTAQWAWYCETTNTCTNCMLRPAAERNFSRCGTCRQGWWPATNKPGGALVMHLLDSSFDGSTPKGGKLCDCGHTQCLKIGYPPNNKAHVLIRVPRGSTAYGAELIAKQWGRALRLPPDKLTDKHRIASWHFRREHLDIQHGKVVGLVAGVGEWHDTNDSLWVGAVPIRPLGEFMHELHAPAAWIDSVLGIRCADQQPAAAVAKRARAADS